VSEGGRVERTSSERDQPGIAALNRSGIRRKLTILPEEVVEQGPESYKEEEENSRNSGQLMPSLRLSFLWSFRTTSRARDGKLDSLVLQ